MSEVTEIKPRFYFVTTGKGISKVSPLNALDNALRDAGIAHLNIVKVTSILPAEIEERNDISLEPGSIAFAVLAQELGKGGEIISAGIAWAHGKPYGYIMEAHGKKGAEEIRANLERMIKEVASFSGLKLNEPRFRIEQLKVPKDFYGAVIAALVFKT